MWTNSRHINFLQGQEPFDNPLCLHKHRMIQHEMVFNVDLFLSSTSNFNNLAHSCGKNRFSFIQSRSVLMFCSSVKVSFWLSPSGSCIANMLKGGRKYKAGLL
ncbi:hypothetical protein CHARACLAT_025195 [Characodon lateralis]|uniref:Uncharacterized protein n=1 Tax=Characodon lateralis TaxID=208331 RepID=A0ABU7D174_9TELE|nr:hypothetical protein [Characodon lateralis]